MILRYTLLFVSLLAAAFGLASHDDPTIFLVGDSTMANKPLIGNPERGWGQMFPSFFNEGIRFENHARNGRSTKSFIREGRWDAVYARLHPGDYVFIQFGHNDAKKEDSSRYAEPHTEYKSNLLRFVRDVRSQQAIPVLLTPVCRRRFDARGKFYDVHGDYPAVVREVGTEENVVVIDVTKKSFSAFDKLGPQKSERLFLRAAANTFSAIPQGKKDDTHFNSYGAVRVAEMVVEGMRELEIPPAKFLKPDGTAKFEGTEKLVMLDNFYNNEWKKDSTGKQARYHYLWHDSTNSGFSALARIITNAGADIDTLCQQPTRQQLQRASIYIIVDSDTRKETENPNVIDTNAANTITEWVKSGGVLVLLGNDKGNAEFEHFNLLAEPFGIHFNEDCRNKVAGKDFATATFNNFPDHPLFTGVRKIFIKELSTLRIQSPAEAVLSDGRDVIMAQAKVGKGFVFAVGDPWLYNEYMGTWRLPEGYDNAKAGDNLFRWLLSNSHSPVH